MSDWTCEHGVSHRACGTCYSLTEPPVFGLGAYVLSGYYDKLKEENEIMREAAQDLLDAIDMQQKNGLGLTGEVCIAWTNLNRFIRGEQ